MPRRPSLGSSSPSSDPASRLRRAFKKVRRFVSRKAWYLHNTLLRTGCSEIYAFRGAHPGKVGERNVMHMGHVRRAICALIEAGTLGDEYLYGLFLHEFGHLGSKGGERAADRWILDVFGIRIQYAGELDLEWVPMSVVRRIEGGKA